MTKCGPNSIRALLNRFTRWSFIWQDHNYMTVALLVLDPIGYTKVNLILSIYTNSKHETVSVEQNNNSND